MKLVHFNPGFNTLKVTCGLVPCKDSVDLPAESEPEMFRDDLATITTGSLKAGD